MSGVATTTLETLRPLEAAVPVRVGGASGSAFVDWLVCTSRDLDVPFMGNATAILSNGGATSFRTTLAAFENCPPPQPAALVFHLARCGSTLFSRLLRRPGQLRVINESPVLNQLLLRDDVSDEQLAGALHALTVGGAEAKERTLIKLSSWNLAHRERLRAVAPATPCLLLRRDPDAITASVRASRPSWIDADTIDVRPSLEALWRHACAAPCWDLSIDYEKMPAACQGEVASLLAISPLDTAELEELLRQDAKRTSCPYKRTAP